MKTIKVKTANRIHLLRLNQILQELYTRIKEEEVDVYYKPTIDYCKELIKNLEEKEVKENEL